MHAGRTWRGWIAFLSGPAPFTYILPVIMACLVAGTVAQKHMGLYAATQVFFSSPVLWLGPVPVPGLPVWLGLVFVNLLFKLVFKSPWTPQRAGTVLAHGAVLFLLLGGMFTALSGREGYMDLAPGEQRNYVTDYHARVLSILDEEGREIAALSHAEMGEGADIALAVPPLALRVVEHCRNCAIDRRADAADDYYGMARHMALSPAPPRRNDEENMAGVTFAVRGGEEDGVYLALENVPKYPEIKANGRVYGFVLRKQRRALPFRVELVEFRRDMHPGTGLAKSYSSRVRIHDNGAVWESVIGMNAPLRYRGYTFFQASFAQTPQGDVSVLAVVRNAGRSFPYIAGIMLCAGLVVHLFARRRGQEGRA